MKHLATIPKTVTVERTARSGIATISTADTAGLNLSVMLLSTDAVNLAVDLLSVLSPAELADAIRRCG